MTATVAQTLFVAWQDPAQRRYFPVGRLCGPNGSGAASYEFVYVGGARQAAEAGFRPLLAFPDLQRVYRSPDLFPFFHNRLMQPTRPDYADFVEALGLDPAGATPIQLLGRSGGARVTDDIELFPLPEYDLSIGGYRTWFLVHGLRHMPESAQKRVLRLSVGARLFWFVDCQNPVDANAIGLRTDDGHMVGFLPNYLLDEAWTLVSACSYIDVLVARISQPPASFAQRLLCEIQSCWPDDFVPLNSERFQPIATDALRVTAKPVEVA